MLSAAAFAPVLGGELVWDDRFLVDGSAIGGGQSLLECFTEPFLWHFFRPLVSISFFFERMLWRGEPLGYHVTNLLLHVGGTAAMMRLLDEAFRSRWTSLLGGLFFAIHPVQVGAVAWIGGRTDSLASIWVLLMSWMLVRSARGPVEQSGRSLAWAVAFFNLAVYTKEQSVLLALLAPVAYRAWRPVSDERRPGTVLVALLAFGLSVALFLTAGYFLGMPRPSPIPYSAAEIAAQTGRTVTYYTLLLFAPSPSWMHWLSLENLRAAGLAPVIFGYGVIALTASLLLRWWRRDVRAAWFLSIAVLAILPVTNALPLPFLIVAPYRAAIPWIGLSGLLGYILGRALDRTSATNRPISPPVVALAVLFAWLGGLTAWGSAQWRSEPILFRQLTRYDPQSIVGWGVYTYSLERTGRFREAAAAQEEALRLLFRSEAWRTLATAQEAFRRDPSIFRRARQNQGTNEDPRIWIAGLYAQLANCRLQAEEHDEAQRILAIGDAIWSNHLRIHLGVAHYAVRRGDKSEAARRYRRALMIDPKNAIALDGLRATDR